jgi:thiol:disulfide interchange protein
LWYAEDGRRISERVAQQLAQQNVKVYSPKIYLQMLGSNAPLPTLPKAIYSYKRDRNGNDTIALLAGTTGLLSLASCFGIGLALCATPLPLLPLILGAIGLIGASNAANPGQARMLSWLGVAGGAGFVALVLLAMIASVAFGTTIVTPWSTMRGAFTFLP